MTGVQLKLRGMRQSAEKQKDDLLKAQYLAYCLAQYGAVITIEDVRAEWARRGLVWTLGNASGNVFNNVGNIKWEFAGFATAQRPQARARIIRQWRLKGVV